MLTLIKTMELGWVLVILLILVILAEVGLLYFMDQKSCSRKPHLEMIDFDEDLVDFADNIQN